MQLWSVTAPRSLHRDCKQITNSEAPNLVQAPARISQHSVVSYSSYLLKSYSTEGLLTLADKNSAPRFDVQRKSDAEERMGMTVFNQDLFPKTKIITKN